MNALQPLVERVASQPPEILGGGAVVVLLLVVLLSRMLRSRPKKGAERGVASVREAERAEKKGDFARAGAIYEAAGQREKALVAYARGECYHEAGRLAAELGKKDRAAQLYERAGDHEQAMRLYQEVRQFEAAARIAVRLEQWRKAAELLEKAGRLEDAADCLERDEDFAAAGSIWMRRKNYERAAAAYAKVADKIARELTEGRDLSDRRRQVLERAASEAARAFERTGDGEKAMQMYRALGRDEDVARVAERFGIVDLGAEALIEAGRLEEAARLLEEAGKATEAVRLRAEMAEREGDIQRAAALYEEAGDIEAAAELYRGMGDGGRAAELMLRCGRKKEAAEYFLKARQADRAAELLMEIGAYDRAAALYQRLGQIDRTVEALVAGGRRYEAGLTLARARRLEEALAMLAGVEESDEQYRRALLLRGEIAARLGRIDDAVELYSSALAKGNWTAELLGPAYRYGLLLEKHGKPQEARRVYRDILRIDRDFRDVRQRYDRLGEDEAGAGTGSEPPSESLGTRKQRYVILDELGRGGMGVVYKAIDRTLDRVVALKVLPSEVQRNEQLVQNFFREAKAAAALNHPYIVTVYDAGEQDGVYYIAMEYIEGRTLKEHVRASGAFPIPHLILVAGQVCRALEYAHQQKIVHRDIKPSNLMWQDREKVVKITDFGLAKVIQEVANFQTIVGGTPHYMSPEQILGEEIDGRADLYSLGATVYELATGSVPYPKGDAGYHHIHSPVPDPRELRPDLPDALAEWIMRAMAKDREQRFESAAAMLRALREIREQKE